MPLTTNASDSGPVELADTVAEKPGFIKRIINYFGESNRDKPDKKFDVTFLGGPSYSDATSVYLAVMAAGIYHTSRDSVHRPRRLPYLPRHHSPDSIVWASPATTTLLTTDSE